MGKGESDWGVKGGMFKAKAKEFLLFFLHSGLNFRKTSRCFHVINAILTVTSRSVGRTALKTTTEGSLYKYIHRGVATPMDSNVSFDEW